MDSKVALFETAMQKVYGPYDLSAQPDSTWKPGNAGGHCGRYLWTDAFGVLNFITLSREKLSDGPAYLHLARQLANTVHEVLGRERGPPGSAARLPDATDTVPLRGGLRIGKLDASGPDGDGMYHHYLTLWMYALDVLARATEEAHWNALAVQLAQAIHPRFMVERNGRESMVWKISTDMRHVLVGSKGHLDDVTGFVVYRMLRDTARHYGNFGDDVLTSEIEQYARIMEHADVSLSGDPLDLGMGLWLAHFNRDAPWSRELSGQALEIARGRFLVAAAKPLTAASNLHRLAFREFGACLGIKCYEKELESLVEGVETVLDIWKGKMLKDEDGEDDDLRPINLVMYAAALITGAFRKSYLGGGISS
ncbi:hypothetical protein E0Z10_g5470 [Xylaria hypoxylon]|uniref:GH15-like domain-containing protein n=1 Tax=Xylaria hypoxylon TaxID=37992 RepID=A0A4Z0YH43_9PEZI|nr:hypothetical protein E0Z10_g5470 [Xylaria hypoxylon]